MVIGYALGPCRGGFLVNFLFEPELGNVVGLLVGNFLMEPDSQI